MRSKMLSSMDTVLESASDPDMVDKALKASATVTANSDQMPLNNQVRFHLSFVHETIISSSSSRKKEQVSLKKLEKKSKIWRMLMIALSLVLLHVCISVALFVE